MYALALHGGAGTIARASLSSAAEQQYRAALEAALTIGYELLRDGAAALDAVEATVRSLEDCPLFNAGRGAGPSPAPSNSPSLRSPRCLLTLRRM